ncbi:MAG: hypothetical protein J2P17_20660, partial [Mycobacterium sp.]|nr:hypothetical protein [Mycobacterium sp.]
SFISDHLWPVITAGLSQPIFWLAIAALVYGSSVISVAELWRKGKPLASRIRIAQRALERASRIQSKGASHARRDRLLTELKEAFFGDIDDKYLPTLHSLRLILRAGVVFLGAYVVVYSAQAVGSTVWSWILTKTIGGHPMTFWIMVKPLYDLALTLPFEPWRLCLLAVALRRCLMIFRLRAERAGTVTPEAGAPRTAREAAAVDLGLRGRAVEDQVVACHRLT